MKYKITGALIALGGILFILWLCAFEFPDHRSPELAAIIVFIFCITAIGWIVGAAIAISKGE